MDCFYFWKKTKTTKTRNSISQSVTEIVRFCRLNIKKYEEKNTKSSFNKLPTGPDDDGDGDGVGLQADGAEISGEVSPKSNHQEFQDADMILDKQQQQ